MFCQQFFRKGIALLDNGIHNGWFDHTILPVVEESDGPQCPPEEPKSAALANRYGLPIPRVAATEFHILLAALLAKLVLIIVYVMDI